MAQASHVEILRARDSARLLGYENGRNIDTACDAISFYLGSGPLAVHICSILGTPGQVEGMPCSLEGMENLAEYKLEIESAPWAIACSGLL